MFIVLIRQDGEGCDYMIDCGASWIKLESETKEEALQEFKAKIVGEWDAESSQYYDADYSDESALRTAILIEVKERTKIPLKEWYAEKEQIEENAQQNIAESADFTAYARLRAKFEK